MRELGKRRKDIKMKNPKKARLTGQLYKRYLNFWKMLLDSSNFSFLSVSSQNVSMT
jgi:hypothetical protein